MNKREAARRLRVLAALMREPFGKVDEEEWAHELEEIADKLEGE